MKIVIKNLSLILLALFLFMPGRALAHQPRIVKGNFVEITNPEVSQAFYGELPGAQVEYRINSDREFRLYVGILVPDIPDVRKDIAAEIYRVKDGGKETVALLDGSQFEWTPFYEDFAKDSYFWGPEYKADDSQKGVELKGRLVPSGDYHIKVFSPTNQGKYSLVVGDLEEFPLKEIINAMTTVPQVKLKFFGEPLSKVLLSPFGGGTILVFYLFAFIVGFLLRAILKKVAKNSPRGLGKNIGKPDRLLRVAIGVGLLVWAITTTWNPILLFFSGFVLFEAIFSWCGFYAALGKNTCPPGPIF
ncbi:MAG: DUF2892 domain-containing protein [Candidatus Atribacteria bacterium]|nr:DUF2892 domain-containing protein [Candidatus Atribacteria bacterium]